MAIGEPIDVKTGLQALARPSAQAIVSDGFFLTHGQSTERRDAEADGEAPTSAVSSLPQRTNRLDQTAALGTRQSGGLARSPRSHSARQHASAAPTGADQRFTKVGKTTANTKAEMRARNLYP